MHNNPMNANQKRSLIRTLKKAILVFFFVALILVVVDVVLLVRALVLQNSDTKATESSVVTSLPSGGDASDSGITPSDSSNSTEPTPTASAINITELLPANALSEAYWGPLPEVTSTQVLDHKEVRAIYIGAAANLNTNIALAQSSEINAFVVDLKESNGVIFNSTNELATSIGDVRGAYNLETVVNTCHENDIRVIGRIVCFKDPTLAEQRPDLSIQDANGQSLKFKNEGSIAFANPYNSATWDYYISLAEEAIAMGVDEIQFDYVRFPTGGTTSGESPYFGEEGTTPSRADAINRFLQTARRRIQDTYGVPVTADVFGIILSSATDGANLGQDWATIGLTGVDALCPMIYPSHYALGTNLNGKTFDKPDLYPYDVLYNALVLGSSAASQAGYSTVRPYLQAFTASYIGEGNYKSYSYSDINDQIRALQDAGYSEWILWNPSAAYPSGTYAGNAG